jgi:hypothetical protein
MTLVRFLSGIQKHTTIFISSADEDVCSAARFQELLATAGFTVLHSGSGRPDDIERCHFFVLLISGHSVGSTAVQRELDLALEAQRRNQGNRPFLIALFADDAQRAAFHSFQIRGFRSGEPKGELTLQNFAAVQILTDEAAPLISQLTPSILASRLDFSDEETFHRSKVFELYEQMFPIEERDSPDDIIDWVLRSDIGQSKAASLSDGTEITYRLDSRYFILAVLGRAIGFAFFTYDYTGKLLYLNYIAVHRCWRQGNVAQSFFREMEIVLMELFPEYRGTVFEVEKFERAEVERIISTLEESPRHAFRSDEDEEQIRRFLRTVWYQSIGRKFFMNMTTGEPLVSRSICLDPALPPEKWPTQEDDFWLMWYSRPGTSLEQYKTAKLWDKAVNSIYIEILAKSIVLSYPEFAQEYWQYASSHVSATLRQSEGAEVALGTFLDRRDGPLSRWYQLGWIDYPS